MNEGLLSRCYAQQEATRYTAWPGQACSYKVGQLKIQALRDLAESELGPAFDIKAFHHTLLKNGSMPLNLLEDQVMHFIKENK